MYLATIRVRTEEHAQAADALHSFIADALHSGQICGKDLVLTRVAEGLSVAVLLAEFDSLDAGHDGWRVKESRRRLAGVVDSLEVEIAGVAEDTPEACACAESPSYVLFTSFLSNASPIRCGACFGLVPLYSLGWDQDELWGFTSWAKSYEAVDSLWMGSGVGERWAYGQMSRLDRALTREGLDLCEELAARTGRPTFYYLHRYRLKAGPEVERGRRCPQCGGEWLLEEPWHFFDFRCEQCSLVSVLAH